MADSVQQKKIEIKKKMAKLKMMQLQELQSEGQAEKPWYDVSLEGLGQSIKEQAPAIGATIGGAVGILGGPVGAVAGAGAGGYLGKHLQNLYKIHGEDEEMSREEFYKSNLAEGLKGATYESGGLIAGKALKTLSKPIGEGIRKARGAIGKTLDVYGEAAPVTGEIVESAERLGLEPTRGLLTGSEKLQNLESAIAQSPTNAGKLMREKVMNVPEGMQRIAGEIIEPKSGAMTPIQLAQKTKENILSNITKKIDPAVSVYKQIEKDIVNIPLNQKSSERIANNIMNLPYSKIKGTPAASFANTMTDNIKNASSLQDLRNIKTYVGQVVGDINANPQLRNTAGKMLEKLTKYEQSSITRAAIEATKNRNTGQTLASNMIKEIKDANKLYGQVSNELKTFSKKVGISGVKNYQDFIRKIESIPDEKLVSKLFRQDNIGALKDLKNQFPEAFDAMKDSYMGDLYNKSITKGNVSLPKLINSVKKMTPEFREMFFGLDSNQKIKDIETIYNKLPKKVGQSGTPEGIEFMKYSVFDPRSWWTTINKEVDMFLLNNPDKFRKLSNRVKPKIKSPLQPGLTTKGLLGREVIQGQRD